MADPRVKKVILYRRTRLDVFVSMIRAATTGGYLKYPLDTIPVNVTPASLPIFADTYDEIYKQYEDTLHGQRVYRIAYEDLIADQNGTVSALLAFLGVDDTRVPSALSKTVKQTCRPLYETVPRFEELEFAFRFSSNANHHSGFGLQGF